MFSTIKKNVPLVAVAEKLFSVVYTPIGENTYGPEDKTCPFCGHKDCFRIKQDESDLENSFYHCFSCADTHGDVIKLVQEAKKLETPAEAAMLLVKEYNLKLPHDYSPVQDAFNLAGGYYHNIFLEERPFAELGGLTPLEYQLQRRGHSKETLDKLQVGWSDGGVVQQLSSLGISQDIITASGLEGKRGDFLPSRVFIYPHYVRGRISHFTFKDPLKQKEYQLPNKYKLNGHAFYNSDSISLDGPVIVVEGENDLASVLDAGWASGVIACIGQISQAQLEWLGINLANRDVITIFDSDPAGDSYREKVGKVKGFKSLMQVKLSGVKDIDEYIQAKGDLVEAIKGAKPLAPPDSAGLEEVSMEVQGSSSLIEKDGAYYRVRYKDGNEFFIKLSNFTIKLRNIFIRADDREREVIIIREDGQTSPPVIVSSEVKVSVRPFRTMIANAVDGTFYGKEDDLSHIWDLVMKDKERLVYLPETVGRVEEFKGWLLRDCLITDSGATYEKDEEGVIWISTPSVGIRPLSLNVNFNNRNISRNNLDIPRLNRDLSDEDTEALLEGFLKNLSQNFNKDGENLGDVLTAVGFCWATVYSDVIYEANNNFPLLLVWGEKDRGKTTIIKWLLDLFDMSSKGYTTVALFNSGVGWGRKMAYYASLPTCIDELRVNKETVDLYSTLRSYYDRAPKTLALLNSSRVRQVETRSTLILGSQDIITDDATISRCILIRIPKSDSKRDKSVAYDWIDSRKEELSAIGYYWMKHYNQFTPKVLTREIKDLARAMTHAGVPSRTAVVWSVAGFFGQKLAERFFPKFDYLGYLSKTAQMDAMSQTQESTLLKFFDIVEGIQVAEKSPLAGDHIRVEKDVMYLWFSEIFREVEKARRSNDEPFSGKAIWEALKEEDYFIKGKEPNGGHRKSMGLSETLRRVAAIDLTKAPEVLQNIGAYARA